MILFAMTFCRRNILYVITNNFFFEMTCHCILIEAKLLIQTNSIIYYYEFKTLVPNPSIYLNWWVWFDKHFNTNELIRSGIYFVFMFILNNIKCRQIFFLKKKEKNVFNTYPTRHRVVLYASSLNYLHNECHSQLSQISHYIIFTI